VSCKESGGREVEKKGIKVDGEPQAANGGEISSDQVACVNGLPEERRRKKKAKAGIQPMFARDPRGRRQSRPGLPDLENQRVKKVKKARSENKSVARFAG
jgi:hypothetical protein